MLPSARLGFVPLRHHNNTPLSHMCRFGTACYRGRDSVKAPTAKNRLRVEEHRLRDANDVLVRLKRGEMQGAAVLVP